MKREFKKQRTWLIVLAIAAVVQGCSGLKTYPNTLDKNLKVQMHADSASLLAGGRLSLDIYQLDVGCKRLYEGTMQLDQPEVAMGLPTDKPSYLVFNFSHSSSQASSSSSMRYDTVLTPHAAYRYLAIVNYKDNNLTVDIKEMMPGRLKGGDVERRPLSACKPN